MSVPIITDLLRIKHSHSSFKE